ncbi:MAG: pyrroline-5-carboxylate reductase [Tissierellaceae bacterium]|nr:pyrroline-5-carboxylate reductase [Tissierellaceae bacterium]
MDKVIGFIGSGNMASAIIGGLIKSNLVVPENIISSAKTKKTIEDAKKKYGIETTLDNREVAKKADYLIIAVKPHMYGEILEEIKDILNRDTIVIGIAAGISIKYLKQGLNNEVQVVKAMPNTPAMVGEGMTGIAFDIGISDESKEEVLDIFNSFGKTEIIDEKLMDAFTAISGSSPAYVYMMIEAMADGGVLEGIPRKQAYTMAAQAVLGAAKMVLDTGTHPGVLKDNVCSPGGTTIEAVAKLEEKGLRTAVIEAMKVCADKSKVMGK